MFVSQDLSHQGYVFVRLLISPMVPLRLCFSAKYIPLTFVKKLVPLRVRFWPKIILLSVRFSSNGPTIHASFVWKCHTPRLKEDHRAHREGAKTELCRGGGVTRF